jgi:AraC-like DNA-binding protein
MDNNSIIINETEALFLAVEQSCNITLSIHDLTGSFRFIDGGNVLSPHRTRHRHPVCEYAHTRNCLRDCQQGVNKKLSSWAHPYKHLCWKGVIEVTYPIYRSGSHIATMFAGCFQEPDFDDSEIEHGYRASIKKLRQRLRILSEKEQQVIEGMLVVLAKALLHQLKMIEEGRGDPDSRKEKIRRFVDMNIHRPITLADISEFICLSQSRTCHIIQDIFGVSLKKMLIKERVDRARHLLTHTESSISDIADRVGFTDVYYFSKIFKREVGLPPGQYRQKHASVIA